MGFLTLTSPLKTKIKIEILCLPMILLTLQGCDALKNFEGFNLNKEEEIVSVQEPPKNQAMERLATAAESASSALIRLSRIETAKSPIKPAQAEGLIPDALERSVSIEWIGPVDGIARKLATKANYRFFLIGKQPVSPVIVDIASKDKSIIEVLKEIGYQAGSRAHVRVDARRSVVEVVYAY